MAHFETIELYIQNGYKIIECNNGHSKPIGIHANKLKNPFWRLIDLKYKIKIVIITIYVMSFCSLSSYSKHMFL